MFFTCFFLLRKLSFLYTYVFIAEPAKNILKVIKFCSNLLTLARIMICNFAKLRQNATHFCPKNFGKKKIITLKTCLICPFLSQKTCENEKIFLPQKKDFHLIIFRLGSFVLFK